MLSTGDPAPDFTLSDADGNPVSLSDFKGQKVVLYFYPKDDTPGCTKEACGFRDAQDDYMEANAVVIGVSPDSEKSHQRFRDKYDLPFLLLADPERQAIEGYDVWKEKICMARSTWAWNARPLSLTRMGSLWRSCVKSRSMVTFNPCSHRSLEACVPRVHSEARAAKRLCPVVHTALKRHSE